MIITNATAGLLIGLILQSVAFAYFMGKLRTDVNIVQSEMRDFKILNDSLKTDINEIKIQLAELRKDLQFLLIPKTRRKTEL